MVASGRNIRNDLAEIPDVLATLRRKLDLLFDQAVTPQLDAQTYLDFHRCVSALGEHYPREAALAYWTFQRGEIEVSWFDVATHAGNLYAAQLQLDLQCMAHYAASQNGYQLGPDFRSLIASATRSLILLEDYAGVA